MVFGKKKPPAYTPKTGDISLDRNQFINIMRTRPVFREYSRSVGVMPAARALNDAFEENLRCMAPSGYWSYGSTARHGNPTKLKFADEAGLDFFMTVIEGLMDNDRRLMDRRATYINSLKGEAAAGLLLQRLHANTVPEANYYQAAPPSAPKSGAPPIPPKPQHFIDRAKALAWLKQGVQGSTLAFDRMTTRYAKTDGSFPFGGNTTILKTASEALVPLAPGHRGWNSAAGLQTYPSNIGGMKVLNDVLTDLATMTMPPRGDNAWYGHALYLMGAIIAAQAFTDGNKRMSRFAYVLMLLSGGVPIVVPNARLGSELGDM